MSLLPLVCREVGYSVAAQFRFQGSDDALVACCLEELALTNPVVGLWIEEWGRRDVLQDASHEVRRAAMFGAILVYKLLESQAQADFLGRLIGGRL